MKYYLQGLGHIASVLVASAVTCGISTLFWIRQTTEVLLYAVLTVGLGLMGFFYKRRNKVIVFTTDSEAHARLAYFLLGVGTLFGPAKAWLAGFPIQGSGAMANVVVLALSVPMSAGNALGVMIIGGLFYKPKQI